METKATKAKVRQRHLAAVALAALVVASMAGACPAWADADPKTAAAREWANNLLAGFPDDIRKASSKEKFITFEPFIDPGLEVTPLRRQREEVYRWMLDALSHAGRTGAYSVLDPREHRDLATALENSGQQDWFKIYQEKIKNYPTRIYLSCKLGSERTLECTALDMETSKPLVRKNFSFDLEWLSKPPELDEALKHMVNALVGGPRRNLGHVEIVEDNTKRETPLAKHIANSLGKWFNLRSFRPDESTEWSSGESATADLKGRYRCLDDKIELYIEMTSSGQEIAAAMEYATVESVRNLKLLDEAGKHGLGKRFRDCKACTEIPEMVVIPPGEYMMGSPAGDKTRVRNEGPRHNVRIGAKVAVGRYEVTRREYAAFIKATARTTPKGCWIGDGPPGKWRSDAGASWRKPGFGQGERHPVVCVSWEDAKAYADWLSDRTGKRYRLLSEAEWEYAARAGTTTARYWGQGSKNQCQHANGADKAFRDAYGGGEPWRSAPCSDGSARTAGVDDRQLNGYGLGHMLGNAWEWVEDCWHDDYSEASGDGSARVEGGDCGKRALRGGSWYSHPAILRSATRGYDAPGSRNFDTGFRVARSLADEARSSCAVP